MDAMKDALNKAGVDEATLKELKAQRVTLPALQALSDDDLKEMIPHIGPRALIKSVIKDLKKPNSGPGLPLSEDQDRLLEDIVDEAATVESPEKSTSAISGHRSEPSNQRPSPPERSTASFDDKALREILKCPKGEMVLADYNNTKMLSNVSRSKLAEVIISHELRGNPDARLPTERAKLIGQAIMTLFPSEVLSIWYREEMRPSGEGRICKGRILTKYYNTRRDMIKCGLIDHTSLEDNIDDYDAIDDDDNAETSTESKAWLKAKNISPWPQVESAWRATWKARLKDLQTPVNDDVANKASTSKASKRRSARVLSKKKAPEATIASYLKMYPQLRQKQGWELLVMDFDSYKPEAAFKLSMEYPKLVQFVLKKLERNPPLLDDLDEDVKAARVFMSMARLIPVKLIGRKKDSSSSKKKKKGTNSGDEADEEDPDNWRLSRQDIKESFLLRAKTVGAITAHVKRRIDKLHSFDLTAQPVAVIVSKDFSEIEKCYLAIDDFKYELDNPLQLMDVVFKVYHALHADYPPESEPIWYFLQKAIYKFDTKWEFNVAPEVDLLKKEYENFQFQDPVE